MRAAGDPRLAEAADRLLAGTPPRPVGSGRYPGDGPEARAGGVRGARPNVPPRTTTEHRRTGTVEIRAPRPPHEARSTATAELRRTGTVEIRLENRRTGTVEIRATTIWARLAPICLVIDLDQSIARGASALKR